MKPSPATRTALLAVVGSIGLTAPTIAKEIRGLPFWSLPYPAYYAYTPPPPSCWQFQRVPGFLGLGYRMEKVWVCGNVISTRY